VKKAILPPRFAPMPTLLTFNCYERPPSTFSIAPSLKGTVEGSDLLDAAQNAATMLFNRAEARKVVVGSQSRGEFIAHGRVSWQRYRRGEVVREVRFVLERKR
jgi:hypothetical protein